MSGWATAETPDDAAASSSISRALSRTSGWSGQGQLKLAHDCARLVEQAVDQIRIRELQRLLHQARGKCTAVAGATWVLTSGSDTNSR